MRKFLLTLLVALSYLQASAQECRYLGSTKSSLDLDSKEALLWKREHSSWSVSIAPSPLQNFKCSSGEYLLLKSGDSKSSRLLHHKNFYAIKKGWNSLTSPKDGVDVAKTFSNVEFVYIYEPRSKLWAGYSPKKELMQKMKSAKILELKYIEPKKSFFLLSEKAMRVAIASKAPNKECQKIIDSKEYELLQNSGASQKMSYNGSKTLAFSSRYFSHQREGIYNDSRVLLMVPKIQKFSKTKKLKKYGPAVPKIMIEFNEAFIGREFYAYDYLNESCYKGYFPSKKRPPSPTLKKVK